MKPHGIRGEVVVEVLTDNASRFAELRQARIVDTRGAATEYTVEGRFKHQDRYVLKFAGIASIEAAQPLRGALIEVPRASLPKLASGSYYHFELEGLRARDSRGREVGHVSGIWETGAAAPVLVIESVAGREILLPFVDDFVKSVDLEKGVMEVRVPRTVEVTPGEAQDGD